MTDTSPRWASVSARFTHGTATQVEIPSVIPDTKQDKEVFWTNTLVARLPELNGYSPCVAPCGDDSHGNHDVIVSLNCGDTIGIQVTELTYELERARKAQAEKFIAEVIACFRQRGLSSARKMLVHCFLPFVSGSRYVVPKVDLLADTTETFIRGSQERSVITVENTKVMFEWVNEGDLYVPSVAGIGISCDLDVLPRTLEMYCDAISCLCDKKMNSNSPWLLVWSTSFLRDKHWLGDKALEHMKATFSSSHFERVYFVESMDGAGFFEANLVVHAIKI
jgi:hypothetical protein